MVANGAEGNPIIFTSILDDSVGGDTNGDGGVTSPRINDWGFIRLGNAGDEVTFSEIRYGTSCVTIADASAEVRLNKFDNCQVAIEVPSGIAVTIQENEFTENGFGIYSQLATGLTITKNKFLGNRGDPSQIQYGIFLQNFNQNVTISQNEISNNEVGVYLEHSVNALVNQNNISGNELYGILDGTPGSPADARNNWWGHPSGPFHPVQNVGGQGNEVSDGVIFDPWLGGVFVPPVVPGRNPVVIIPGIIGTELYNGDDLIWPDLGRAATDINDQFLTDNLGLDAQGNSLVNITTGGAIKVMVNNVPLFEVNIFKDLEATFEDVGYQQNTDLFYFPYDWRLDLENTKDLLNQEIENIKVQTGAQKVDVIAHSMGGLLVKSYIDNFGAGDIDKLIFVGTPHLGAPKAGKVILEGERFKIFFLEEDRMQELALNSPALHELLPNETYFSQFQGYISPFSFFGPLEFLNYQQTTDFFVDEKQKNPLMFQKAEIFFSNNLENIDYEGINAYNIVGCKTSTQAAYRMGLFGSIAHVGYTSGDGTVPIVSASYAPGAKNYYVKNGEHAELPSRGGVKELIADLLNGSDPNLQSGMSETSAFCKFKGKQLIWRSPVEVHIYDSAGNHTGPLENNSIEYNVPGVDYDVIGEEKFIFLPTDEGQTYNIHGIGLEEGKFDLQISEVDDGETNSSKIFNDVLINTATPIDLIISGASPDAEILVNNLLVPASAELFGGQILDFAPPETTAVASGPHGNEGWYLGDVDITLNTQDDISGVLETKYSLDNGQSFLVYNGSTLISEEGIKNILYYSVDKAGNNEAVKSLEIKIDKSPPEITYQFDLILKDFIFDTIEESATLTCSLKNCVAIDQAGNQTRIDFERQKVLNLRGLSLKSITQKGQTKKFSENLLLVKLIVKKNQIVDFNQTIIISKQEVGRIDYVKKTDTSRISEFRKGTGFNRYTLPGIHFLKIVTAGNYLNINIQ